MVTKIRIQTNKGDIVAELWSDDAINTVKNFTTLAQKGYYDGLKFHRVVPDFVIQGGDPKGDGTGGPGYAIPCETRGHRQKHKVGAFSMAHAGRDTGGSQFFIVLNEQNCKHLDGKHTVFGQTVEGLDIVKSIREGDTMIKVEVLELDPAIEAHELQTMRVVTSLQTSGDPAADFNLFYACVFLALVFIVILLVPAIQRLPVPVAPLPVFVIMELVIIIPALLFWYRSILAYRLRRQEDRQ